MATGIVIVAIALLVVAAALEFAQKRRAGAWLLVVFPVLLCAAGLMDVSRGARALGEAAYESDLKQLGYCLILLFVTVLAAFQPRQRWLFWAAWLMNAAICAVLVYLAFFWKVFS